MANQPALPPVSKERSLFTWLVRLGVLANLAVVALIAYFYFAS